MRFGSKNAAKVKAREWLIDLYKTGQITREELMSIGLYKSVGKHDGKEFSIFSWKEFDEEGEFGALLDQATVERSRLDLQRKEAIRTQAGEDALRFQREELGGRAYTEDEVKELINNFKNNPANAGIKVPEVFTQLANDTQEDRADAQIDIDLEARRRKGLPILPKHYRGITDDTMYKKWAEFSQSAAGQGVSKRSQTYKTQVLDGATASHKNETLGATIKSWDYRATVLSAEARVQELYELSNPQDHPDPDALYREIVDRVKD